MKMTAVLCVAAAGAVAQANQMVLLGDSWGTRGNNAFFEVLKQKASTIQAVNICVGGSTANEWATEEELANEMKSTLKASTEVVWVTLMGNDLQNGLPGCAQKGHSAEQCVKLVLDEVLPHMQTVIKRAHALAPKARVVGFGYDILAAGCPDLQASWMPQCKGDTACFNKNFLALQGVWDKLAAEHPYVDSLNLLGGLQQAAGDPKASLGSPDLSSFTPASLYADCIHPNDKGFNVVFGHMYDTYLFRYDKKPSTVPPPLPTSTLGPDATSAAPAPRENTQHGDGNELSDGAVAGIVVGAVVGVALVVAAVWFFARRQSGGRQPQDVDVEQNDMS